MSGFKKKLLLLLLAVFAAVGSLCGFLFFNGTQASAAQVTLEKAEYFKIEDGVFKGLTEDAYKGVGRNLFSIKLPNTVTAIGDGNTKPTGTPVQPTANLLFSSNGYDVTQYLEKVEFAAPEKITSIGYRAFVNCTALKEIDLSGMTTLSTVQDDVFRGCSELSTITLPQSVMSVPANMFKDCLKLSSVTLGDHVTTIGANAFEKCGKLSQLPTSAALTQIGEYAFMDCDSLGVVTIPNTVTTISKGAFSSCVGISEFNFPINNNFVVICESLLSKCSNLQRVNPSADQTVKFNIPASVKKVEKNAFNGCIKIDGITIPGGITEIYQGAFSEMDGVRTINYYAKEATAEIPVFTLSETGYRVADVDVNIGNASNQITKLPQGLFKGHKAVNNVVFDNVDITTVENFGADLFMDCTSLKKVSFMESCTITIVNTNAFNGCTTLHTVSGLESVHNLQTISDKAFYNCRSLTTFTIGSEVSSIGSEAFYNCTRLIEVENLSATIKDLKAGDKTDTAHGGVAWYAKHVYTSAGESRIKNTADDFMFYADETKSDIQLLGYNGSLTTVTLPVSYTGGLAYDIYQSAFYGNTTMTSLIIPNGANKIEHIGASAFEGCTSLTEVDLSSGLLDVGESVFEGCTSLRNVDFNNNNKLQHISTRMFANCSSLSDITLPESVTTIGTFAFSGCRQLNSVKLGNKITTINGHAFENCNMLTVVNIPKGTTKVDTRAFLNCGALKFVYLPASATYGTDVFKGCAPDVMLISASQEQYLKDKDTAALRSCFDGEAGEVDQRFTYLVKLELIYDDGCVSDGEGGASHVINKLFGKPGDYSQYASLFWAQTGRMPVQGGHGNTQAYMTSEWFADQEYTQPVEVEQLTEKLETAGVTNIKLYARYFDHPDLAAPNDVTYSVDSTHYTVKDILTKIFKEKGQPISDARADKLMENFGFSVVSHQFTDGSNDTAWNWVTNDVISEAGTYVVNITLPTDGSYGSWENAKTVTFKILPGEVDITDLLVWNPVNGSLAPNIADEPETLYFYNNETPHLDKLPTGEVDEKGNPIYQEPSSTVKVINSYTVVSANEITVKLMWKDGVINYGEPSGATYEGNVGLAAGTYHASVNLKPNNNYKFTFKNDAATLQKLALLGLSFEAHGDGSVIVHKTWYIAISNANQLLSGDNNGGMFNIPGEWNYLDGSKIPARPRLSQINEQAPVILTFKLEFTDPQSNKKTFGREEDDNKISINSYEKYINSSMPAGDYTITFYIADGYDANGDRVSGDPSGIVYKFRVKEIPLTDTDRTAVSIVLKDYNVEFNVNKLNFAPTEGIGLLNKLSPSKPQAAPASGLIWREYPQYYLPFSIKYRVVKQGVENPDEKYYTEEEYAAGGSDMVKPQAIGTYTIYYVIAAPNYSGKVEGSYKLNIIHYLNPVLPDYNYRAGNVLNDVIKNLEKSGSEYFDIYTMLDYGALDENDLLRSLTKSANDGLRNRYMYNSKLNDSYSEVGTHKIFLKIKTEYSEYIKWDGAIPSSDITTQSYLVLSVEIVATTNIEVKPLSVTEWEYNKFDEDINKPVWQLAFDDDYTKYLFTLELKSDSTKKYFYHGDPELNKEFVDSNSAFNDAPAGKYTLIASAPENDEAGYGALTVRRDVTISKSEIYFDSNPYISGWAYGQVTKDSDIVPEYALGSDINAAVKDTIVVKFSKAEKDATIEANLAALADASGNVPAGDYLIIFTRDEDDNYEALNYSVKFSVLKAHNYWDEVPTIQSWVYGTFESSHIPTEFKPHFGKNSTVICEIRLEGEAFFKFEEHPRYQNGQLGVGSYEMRVRVLPDTNSLKNFTGIETIIPFTVTQSDNSWKTAPTIKSWTYGSYSSTENSPFAEAVLGNGEIVYQVFDKDGNECDISKLNSLKVGEYKLVATIAATDNYKTLTTTVYFNVLEDSVGLTGIMIATIVFSVIALGLAVAGITLLILRSKKSDTEFRKSVKNELRRK